MADDTIKEALEAFKACEERDRDNYAAYEEDVRFARLEEQWPEDVARKRLREGRPMHVVNKLAPIIRQVVNDARQNKPQITVRPQDSKADPETAELLSGLVRNIESSSNADIAYDTAVENAVSGGFGYVSVNLDYSYDDTFEKDIVINRVANPLSVHGDPESYSADGSDWNLAFECDTMSEEAFERKYPDATQTSFEGSEMPDGWQEGEFITVAAYWTREEVEREIFMLSDGMVIPRDTFEEQAELFAAMGVEPVARRKVKSHKVKQRIISGVEVLETNDWAGCYIPIIPVYGDEIVLKNKRYLRSLIRSAKGAQERYNYWVTAMTEMAALGPKVPYIGPEGAFDIDIDKWSTANNESHAFLEYRGPTAPQRQPGPQIQPAMMQEARAAADDVKAVTGIYDASLGARSNETSGRAIMARQREGDVSTFHFIDNLQRSIRQVGRVVVDLIPRVYTQDRIVRVLGIDGKSNQVPLGQEVKDDKTGLTRVYDLTVGKYDVTVKAGPSYTTQREETRTELVELIRAVPQSSQALLPMYLRQSDFPEADEAADKLEGKSPEQQGQGVPPQVQQQLQQMQQAIQQGQQQLNALAEENKVLKLDVQNRQVELQIKDKEANAKTMDAETRRIQAQADAMRAQAERANPYSVAAPSQYGSAA